MQIPRHGDPMATAGCAYLAEVLAGDG
eukprot:COSAG02_NODE_25635_length_653_cov_0.657040_1_plen_26_part_10